MRLDYATLIADADAAICHAVCRHTRVFSRRRAAAAASRRRCRHEPRRPPPLFQFRQLRASVQTTPHHYYYADAQPLFRSRRRFFCCLYVCARVRSGDAFRLRSGAICRCRHAATDAARPPIFFLSRHGFTPIRHYFADAASPLACHISTPIPAAPPFRQRDMTSIADAPIVPRRLFTHCRDIHFA